MADVAPFTKMIPGFDFLEGLVRNATGAMPAISNWVAPTLNPEELDKRIQDLKAVKFWLEQNARLLTTTIQALEVQRMTLTTLRTMNVRMDDLRESLKIKLPEEPRRAPSAAPAAAPAPVPSPPPPPAASAAPAAKTAGAASQASSGEAPPATGAPAAAAAGIVDPMQWWGALTKQFSELAAVAMKESAEAMKSNAGVMQQAGSGAKTEPAAKKAAAAAKGTAKRARKTASREQQEPPR